jgi:hypothetical protein
MFFVVAVVIFKEIGFDYQRQLSRLLMSQTNQTITVRDGKIDL